MALVSTALATKSVGVRNPEIEGRALIFAGVLKVDTNPMYTGGHGEGNFEIRFVLRTCYVAGEHERRLFARSCSRARVLCKGRGHKHDSQQKEVRARSGYEIQHNSSSCEFYPATGPGVPHIALVFRAM
jgi:hypothetical protein